MGKVIAVTGKGGVGKTLLSTLLVKQVSENPKVNSVLALDADPDANFSESLGVKFNKTLGDIREEVSEEKLPPGIDKIKFFDSKIFEITTEEENFDLLVMGRPEGPGCYCAVNHMLRDVIDRNTKNYDYAIIDTEAGLEHLSRRTTADVDVLLVVTDNSKKSFETAKKIIELTRELKIKFGEIYLVINRLKEENNEGLEDLKKEIDLDIIGEIHDDDQVREFDMIGRPIAELPKDSKTFLAVEKITEKLLS